MCLSCNKKVKSENLTNNKCLECYEAYKKSEATRIREDILPRKLTYIKKLIFKAPHLKAETSNKILYFYHYVLGIVFLEMLRSYYQC